MDDASVRPALSGWAADRCIDGRRSICAGGCGEPDLTQLLAPPPDPNSPLEQYDEKKMAQILASRTDAGMVRAAADAHRSVFVFGDVLGDGFTPPRVPLTTTFFDRVDSDTELLVDRATAYCEDARVIPQRARRFCSLHGHSTLANGARETGRDISTCLDRCAKRLIAGVHYPSDVQAGGIAGRRRIAAASQVPNRFRRRKN